MKKVVAFRPSFGGSTVKRKDGFEEKSLADIKAYIHETREHGLILGDKYITHDLVPSFYLAD